MINQFKAVQSCLLHLELYADAKGYDIAIDGTQYTPQVGVTFLEESFLTNDNEQGLSNSASQVQRPIYQVKINTPKDFGKWKGNEILDELIAHFERGSNISNDAAQQVRIEQVNSIQLPATDTHNVIAVSVNLIVTG